MIRSCVGKNREREDEMFGDWFVLAEEIPNSRWRSNMCGVLEIL